MTDLLTPFTDHSSTVPDLITDPTDCADCNTAKRFCVGHLRAFVSEHATKRDEHTRRMTAYQASVARQEAAERRQSADARLDRAIVRLISTRPRDLGRLLMLAVERHESEVAAIALDLAVVLGERA